MLTGQSRAVREPRPFVAQGFVMRSASEMLDASQSPRKVTEMIAEIRSANDLAGQSQQTWWSFGMHSSSSLRIAQPPFAIRETLSARLLEHRERRSRGSPARCALPGLVPVHEHSIWQVRENTSLLKM